MTGELEAVGIGRLLVIVHPELVPHCAMLAAQLGRLGIGDVRFASVHIPTQRRRSAAECLYRWLDRRLFLPQRQVPGMAVANANQPWLDAPHAGWVPQIVLNLTGVDARGLARYDTGAVVVDLRFGSQDAPGSLFDGVRRHLGHRWGCIPVVARVSGGDGSPIMVWSTTFFLDHRSYSRSCALVVAKLPAILVGAWRRYRLGSRENNSTDTSKAPQPLSPWRLLLGLQRSVLRRALWRDQWEVRVFRTHDPLVPLSEPWTVLRPPRTAFWADPSIVPMADGSAVVFFEELPYRTGKGHISFVAIDAQGRPTAPQVAVDRRWHLSYPFIFEWAGVRYMIPESASNRSVELLRCERFPEKWKSLGMLIEGVALADATLVHWNGHFWMFAAHGLPGASNYDELHVYWADELAGPWRAHRLNPVKIDAGSSRPAGPLFVYDGYLVRPTQDCRNRYGDAVKLMKVTRLDQGGFEEEELGVLGTGPTVRPGQACHTFWLADGLAAIDVGGTVGRL